MTTVFSKDIYKK